MIAPFSGTMSDARNNALLLKNGTVRGIAAFPYGSDELDRLRMVAGQHTTIPCGVCPTHAGYQKEPLKNNVPFMELTGQIL
jgi:hypothetical protein